jgi:hypothetical protein
LDELNQKKFNLLARIAVADHLLSIGVHTTHISELGVLACSRDARTR